MVIIYIAFLFIITFFAVFNPWQDKELIARIFITLMLSIVFIKVIFKEEIKIRKEHAPLFYCAALFIAFIGTPMGQLNYQPLINQLIGICCFYFAFNIKRKYLFRTLIVLSIAISIYVLLVKFKIFLIIKPAGHATFPLIGQKNDVGMLLVLFSPFALYLMLESKTNIKYILSTLYFVLLSTALMYTRSRSAFLAYIIISIIMMVKYRNIKMIPIVFVLAIMILYSTFYYWLGMSYIHKFKLLFITQTAPRLIVWERFIEKMARNPFGCGMGQMILKDLNGNNMGGCHNVFMDLYGNCLVFGFIAFMYIFWKAFKNTIKQKSVRFYYFLSFLGFIIAGQFTPCHKNIITIVLLWTIISMGFDRSRYIKIKNRLFRLRWIFSLLIILSLFFPYRFYLDNYFSNILLQDAVRTDNVNTKIELLNVAINLQPTLCKAFYYHGCCEIEIKNYKQAIIDFENVECLHYDYCRTKEALKFLYTKVYGSSSGY